MEDLSNDSIEIPVTGELDLHTFRAEDAGELLGVYFQACLAKQIFTVRVVHGKGTGALRETVHHHLRENVLVHSFSLAETQHGGWGATWVKLKKQT